MALILAITFGVIGAGLVVVYLKLNFNQQSDGAEATALM
jgi:hypothetical protein